MQINFSQCYFLSLDSLLCLPWRSLPPAAFDVATHVHGFRLFQFELSIRDDPLLASLPQRKSAMILMEILAAKEVEKEWIMEKNSSDLIVAGSSP